MASPQQHAMYMLAACPRNATADASLLCRPGSADDAESGDHLRDVPVRSLATGVTYANVYCARCHGDADRLQSWDASVQCSEFGLRCFTEFPEYCQVFLISHEGN